jgi:hypothetical protein
MFLRSFALINSADRLDALPSGRPTNQSAAPLGSSTFSNRSSNWNQSAVAAELVSLTRLFKRLMRSRSRSTPVGSPRISHATPTQWQSTVASVRHALPADAMPHATSCRSSIHGSDRVPAMLRKAQAARRLSPVRVGGFVASGPTANKHPRVHADPVDPQRVVISGSFAEVCATLDRLVDTQEAAAAKR